MPVNEFEKQVQQRLEELKLRPSEQVWAEVEFMIRREKKRRRIILFWWLLPLLLTGGTAGYFLMFRDGSNAGPEINRAATASPMPLEKHGGAQVQPPAIDKNKQGPASGTVADMAVRPGTSEEVVKVLARKEPAVLKQGAPAKTENDGELIISVEGGRLSKADFEEPAPAGKTPDLDGIPLNSGRADLVPKPGLPLPEKGDGRMAADSVVTDMHVGISPSEESKPAVRLSKSKWYWGIEAGAGLVNSREGRLFGAPQKSLTDVLGNVGSGSGFTASPLSPPVNANTPENGIAGILEVFAGKIISKKIDLRAGLHYRHYTTHVKVGEKVSALRQFNNELSSGVTVSSYYQAGNLGYGEKDYENRYQFLGVSASISWKFLERKHFSLSWENGLSADRLLHTNALLFDRNTRSYYEDMNAFRKMQVFFRSGLSIPIGLGGRTAFSLHPSATYGLSPLLRRSGESNSHFIYYGVGARLDFPLR